MSARVGAGLTVMALIGVVRGAGCEPRELPPNAVQPPGASFERRITARQMSVFARDTVAASAVELMHRPVSSVVNNLGRMGERTAVRAVEAVPYLPIPPVHQCPEAGGPLTPARITPLFDSAPAYRALLDLIASARRRVDLMIYSWDDDEVAGRPVAASLIERARAGVLVRVMVDRGSFVTGADNDHVARGRPSFLDALRAEPNARVIESPDPFLRLDHRKVAVIDDRVVWTGGMVLTRASLLRWHNFAFLAEGPIVPQYAALFDGRWEELGGCRAPACPRAAEAPDVPPNSAVRMVRTDIRVRTLKEAVYGAVDAARHHIYIENCYFSDAILVKKLVAARARGVDVRAVLTMRGDVRALNRFAGRIANQLLRAGARVYLYAAMTHVKAMSVDGALAYIGTGNFDELSLRNNREVGLTVRGPGLIREIDENLFLRDMAASEELHALLPTPRVRPWMELLSIWY